MVQAWLWAQDAACVRVCACVCWPVSSQYAFIYELGHVFVF